MVKRVKESRNPVSIPEQVITDLEKIFAQRGYRIYFIVDEDSNIYADASKFKGIFDLAFSNAYIEGNASIEENEGIGYVMLYLHWKHRDYGTNGTKLASFSFYVEGGIREFGFVGEKPFKLR